MPQKKKKKKQESIEKLPKRAFIIPVSSPLIFFVKIPGSKRRVFLFSDFVFLVNFPVLPYSKV